ncbi:ATP-dependent zinc metalloprotease FtsH [Conexibacter sp. CPCC 206217]|uniref:ATP-dependent zinc metalloprotease FtsH n=1 Tax=Conexibacter sp. CPCC 206217 TaxID=3064574 RepID=UPI00271BB615|nr:ATP-dependent zinc metalloprotease FtsH [Conexibacter sp. CPCC 206217]MDO8213574.1 ATP-dependent zinc metalloprotease FtsH [Conexibacter sp. CPCC 206217]
MSGPRQPAQRTPAPQLPRQQPTPQQPGQPSQTPKRRGWPTSVVVVLALLLIVADVVFVSTFDSTPMKRVRVPYTPTFVTQLRDGNVAEISSKGSAVEGRFRTAVRYPADSRDAPTTLFSTEVPTFADTEALADLIDEHAVVVNATSPQQTTSPLLSALLTFGPLLLIGGVLIFMLRRGGAGGAAGFGRSRARRVEPTEQRITFADVAGIEEAKDELVEIVDFLRQPQKYRRLGGRIPRGVLLTGLPGTGKTLLARAVAGEAEVPFFSISASEFVELYVGVGASRVRDLFAKAKQAAPAIVFIDELDAIGRSRSSGAGGVGGSDEREQTLNQILTEMDGFDTSIGVIVLAATNRPEILDTALLRPGRFDRRIAIQPPDTAGRREILAVHTRSVPLAAEVDLDQLASTTIGMVGADLANIVNEAALLAARRGRDEVTERDFGDALEKLLLGSERRIMLELEDRRRTAVHESGHALVAMLTPGADPVRKISIIPRGAALGVTLSAPEADRFSYDRAYLTGKLAVLMGGRVAEELRFDEVTTGAEDDLRQATALALSMVGRWGMSDRFGPLVALPPEGQQQPYGATLSPDLQQLLDEEVRRLLDDVHERVTRLLSDHGAQLDALAATLLQRETLDETDAYAAVATDRQLERSD